MRYVGYFLLFFFAFSVGIVANGGWVANLFVTKWITRSRDL